VTGYPYAPKLQQAKIRGGDIRSIFTVGLVTGTVNVKCLKQKYKK